MALLQRFYPRSPQPLRHQTQPGNKSKMKGKLSVAKCQNRILLRGAGIALSSILLFPVARLYSPAVAAERIDASYGALESSISIADLEKFAQEGRLEGDLATYLEDLNPQQLAQLRRALLTPIDLSSVAVSQFLYSAIGETLLKRLGQIIRTEAGLSGFYAIRAAAILAAADPQGLTLVNALRRFPTNSIRVDVGQSLEVVEELEESFIRTSQAIALIEQQSNAAATSQPQFNFSQLPDLRQRGPFTWNKQVLMLYDRQRDRRFPVDIYLPQKTEDRRQETEGEQREKFQIPNSEFRIPVIVISHGLGSDRTSFEYLAEQLASYGLAVAVPEHPNSNAEQLRSLLAGRASDVTPPSEFINRPLDVKYLLDVLERLDRANPSFQLNLQQVGVIGHSLGGYTALALAGADLNFAKLKQDCEDLNNSLNLSLLLQCRALPLRRSKYNLQDKRIKAAIAINPITSSIFGEAGLSKIQVPVTIIGSSADRVAPALSEQILPFTWLTAPDKYLVLLEGGTHFSATAEVDPKTAPLPIPASAIGPEPALARRYLQALSVAFCQTYVAGSQQYRPFLSAAYTQAISQPPLNLSLVQSLPINQLAQFVR